MHVPGYVLRAARSAPGHFAAPLAAAGRGLALGAESLPPPRLVAPARAKAQTRTSGSHVSGVLYEYTELTYTLYMRVPAGYLSTSSSKGRLGCS